MSSQTEPMDDSHSADRPSPVTLPDVDSTAIAVEEKSTESAEKVAEEREESEVPQVEAHNEDQRNADNEEGPPNTDPESGIRNRELKSLLQLSKEANLETNIEHKRNTLTPEQKDPKRSMRSQNPEFAAKQQSFLTKVAQGHVDSPSEKEDKIDRDDNSSKKRKRDSSSEPLIGGAIDNKNRKLLKSAMELVQKNKDGFCWRCHREGVNVSCTTCPRSYHTKCLRNANGSEHWICPECSTILTAESLKTRSPALRNMPLGHLCKLLKFALKRMVQINDSEPFVSPVDETEFPEYKKYIVQRMDFTKLEKNIKANLYGSTKAFEADAKWLLHNSIIFNTNQCKLTTIAKSIIKVCKQEMAEIENCSTCYLNANTKKSWFVEVCPKPHLLVWAKLKGFPYWPAKVMCTNNQGLVDVRFFGAHDRAWVSVKECYLYSIKDPNMNHYKRDEINECMREVEIYIQNLKSIYGRFNYPPYKTLFDSEHELEQLQMLLPEYKIDTKKDSEHTISSKPVQNKEESSDEEEDWEVRKYIEEGRSNKSPTAELTLKHQAVRKTPIHKRHARTSPFEEIGPPKKTSRQSSSHSESSHLSNLSDKVSKKDSAESENSKDSSVFDDKNDATGSKSTLVLKMADKLMKKLAADEAAERVVITSCENSPEKCVVESENESENDVPSINDIKQVILGTSSSQIKNESSETITEETREQSCEELRKENDSNSNKSDLNNPSIAMVSEAEYKEVVHVKAKDKMEIQNCQKTEVEANNNKNEEKPPMHKQKMEHKRGKLHLNAKSKSENKSKTRSDLKSNDLKPAKLEDTETNANPTVVKSQPRKILDIENMEDEESLLEEMYSEVVEEQIQKQKETPMKNINGTIKRKRTTSPAEVESAIDNELVKLVDIDLIKNPKLHPLDIPGHKPSTPLVKEKTVSPNTFNGLVEIKYEIDSDEGSTSDDYDSSPYMMQSKVPERAVGSRRKNAVEKDKSVTLVRNPVSTAQRSSQMSLLKTQHPQKVTSTSSGSLGSPTTSVVNVVTTKITTTGIDSGSMMILAQPKFVSNQIVLPPNQSISYGGNSIFVQHPQFSNYLIPTTALNVSTISLPASTKQSQVEQPTSLLKVSQTQASNAAGTKPIQNINGNTPKIQTQNVTVSKPMSILTMTSKTQTATMTKPTLLNTSNIKQGVTSTKSSVAQINQPQSSVTVNTSIAKTIQTSTSSTLAKINLSRNTSSPAKAVTKQLPPLRRASQLLPFPSQLTLTTIANSPYSTTTISTITTGTTTIPPPITTLITTAATSSASQVVAVSASNVVVTSAIESRPITTATRINSKVESMDDYNFLTGHVPERLVRALTEITDRSSLPVLTPKPQGPLTANLDQGLSSSAGPVASKVNSIAHKLTDYFRTMLVEFLSEFGTQENPEAAIANLKLEIEQLKQMHGLEVYEMKKNLQTILREMQKNFSEERQRIVDETRKNCELEAIKRVDEAKSKQWCSNCMKEAQFYCCWNTSYCDYPCQIEHWPTHMEKCTQNSRTDSTNGSKPNFAKRAPISKPLPGCNLPHKQVKKCFVPTCLNSTENSTKLFLVVPREEERRRRWLETVYRQYVRTGCLYCCEDHFNLKEDAENWEYFKAKGTRIIMRRDIVPHLNLFKNDTDNNVSQLESDVLTKCTHQVFEYNL